MTSKSIKLSEVRKYHKIWKECGGDVRYSEIFNGKNRIYIDYNEVETTKKISDVQKSVTSLLKEKGYTIKNYIEGTASKETNSNEFKIGKILQRIDTVIKNQFDSDATRDCVKVNKSGLKIVISKHPLDIASMSTGRGWSSCMDIRIGQNKRYVKEDIREGTLVAYLIKDTDLNIKHPIARVLIKPYVNAKKNVMLITENRVYGTTKKGFQESITAWLKTVQSEERGIYFLNEKLYKDGSYMVMRGIEKPFNINSVDKENVIFYDNSSVWGIANLNGDIIIEGYYSIVRIDDGIYKISTRKGHSSICGFVFISNSVVTKIIEPEFHSASILMKKYIIENDGRLYGLKDLDGNVIIERKYNLLQIIDANLAIVRSDDQNYSIFDIKNKKILYTSKKYAFNILSKSPFLFTMSNSSTTIDVIDENGNILFSCKSVNTVSKNYLVVTGGNNKKAVYNVKTGEFITEFLYNSINYIQKTNDSGITFIASKRIDSSNKALLLDVDGNEYLTEKMYDFCNQLTKNLVRVGYSKSPVIGSELFNIETMEIVISEDRNYTNYSPTSDNKIIVHRNFKLGIVDENFVEILDPIYDDVRISRNCITFKESNLWGYVKDGVKSDERFHVRSSLTKHITELNKAVKAKAKEEAKLKV